MASDDYYNIDIGGQGAKGGEDNHFMAKSIQKSPYRRYPKLVNNAQLLQKLRQDSPSWLRLDVVVSSLMLLKSWLDKQY